MNDNDGTIDEDTLQRGPGASASSSADRADMLMEPAAATLDLLAERYDCFLVDQFGVLHDGQHPYDGAVEALSRLTRMGKSVVLLSNSGRRAAANEERLVRLGFEPGSWRNFVSSGEVAWQMLRTRGRRLRGERCLLLSREGDLSAIEGLGLSRTESGEDADIVLIAGSDGDRISLDDYRRLLEPAARRSARAMCTNPDRIMLTAVGPRFGAGRIGELYEEMGGTVTWIGKPFPEIYRAALDGLGQPDPARVICIGDSVEHDIRGALAAGLGAALVRSGILADLAEQDLQALFAANEAVPDYIVPAFTFDRSG